MDGKTKLNPASVDAVLQEQKDIIAKIKSISPEIKILYTYKMVLNAVAIVAPQKYSNDVSELDVNFIEPDERFAKPTNEGKEQVSLSVKNSVTFIGVDKVHQMQVTDEAGVSQSLTGHGIKIGIIDSGIDYTHAMLGGSGLVSEHEAIDANEASDLFPNQKVVGGMDFVGDVFDTSSNEFKKNVPKPDGNPIDIDGHGVSRRGNCCWSWRWCQHAFGCGTRCSSFCFKSFW